MERIVQGTGVALITPFTIEGSIDFAALKKQISRLLESQIDFLVPLGTTAETPTLGFKEEEAILDCVFNSVPTGFPVWVGCGGNNTQAVARKMSAWGQCYPLTGFLSVSPYYNRPTQEGLYQHFSLLAKATSKPILLYNVPARTGRSLLPETVIRLACDFPSIIGIKEASANLSLGLDILYNAPTGFIVLSGDDKLALSACGVGYQGSISVLANLFPYSFKAMLSYVLNDSGGAHATEIQKQLFPFFDLIFEEGNPSGIKSALSLLGICRPDVRLPLVSASPSLTQRLKHALAALGPYWLELNHASLVKN